MEFLDGKNLEALLKKGYQNDFSNLLVVAAHGIDQTEFDSMVYDYFKLSPNPSPQTILISDLNPSSLNGDTQCFEFTFGNANNNSDISWSVVKWNDDQNGTRISVNSILGLVKWFAIDAIAVTKSKDTDGEDMVIYAGMRAGNVMINMDLTRIRP